MTMKLGVIMDPIQNIKFKKDTTLALLLEAQKRNWELFYFEQRDLFVIDGIAKGHAQKLRVYNDEQHWFEFEAEQMLELSHLNIILMRKDPPFDIEYIYTTYILELAEARGVLVVNKPQGLRDANEKLFTQWFPECIPETLVTRDKKKLQQFIIQHQDVVIKPLHSMGGGSVFRLTANDVNINVAIEVLTENGKHTIMAQKFIADIAAGDKRIFLIDGEPVPYALARIPAKGEIRGNLAAGGTGKGVKLSARDKWICERVSPFVRDKGLLFVGLDVIGDYLTEINVTSPTCVREIESFFDINISAQVLDCIEKKLTHK